MRREPAVWTAHHSNGWDTHVPETVAGEFEAWAAPRGVPGVTKSVEMDERSAKAAFYSLERRTRHTHCSPECSRWELHTHLVDSQPADLDDRAVVQESLTDGGARTSRAPNAPLGAGARGTARSPRRSASAPGAPD